MITLTGVEGSAEFEAAKLIKSAFESYWPGIDNSRAADEELKIAANVKVAGYATNDIDIVVCGHFRAGRRFIPTRLINDADGTPCRASPISIYNLAVTIEVKSHSYDRIRFDGDTVYVQYSRNGVSSWHDATGQNEKQLYTLQNYFGAQQIKGWIYRLIILDSLTGRQTPAGVLAADFKADELLTEIASISPPQKSRRSLFLRTFNSIEESQRALAAPIFRQTIPTNLDRKKMDRIARKRGSSAVWYESLGKEMLIFRGRGGAGKTVLLLQLAHQVFRERASRSLLLTYNRALAADIGRSMSLMNVPSSPDDGGIAVQTVMSFVMTWLNKLGVLSNDKSNENKIELDEYPLLCKQGLQLFNEGAATDTDIEAAKSANRELLDFDYVLIDEGQDWPQEEAELITKLYPTSSIVIADGFDQLIRGHRTDWSRIGPATEARKVVPLRRCLRMKANLARFANAVADRAGLDWDVEPNDKAGGGNIIVLKSPYVSHDGLHENFIKKAESAGNQPVDFLFCVPPSNLIMDGNKPRSKLSQQLEEYGWDVWDGTDPIERRDFPRGIKTHRIVQYDSCRGLEGWIVIAEEIDEFWSYKKKSFVPDESEPDLYKTQDEIAAEAAWRWCLIAMTRPIDTMIITLSDTESVPGKLLREVSKDLPDIVEWKI